MKFRHRIPAVPAGEIMAAGNVIPSGGSIYTTRPYSDGIKYLTKPGATSSGL